ncbi:putative efflux pump antibiotic resistance protein [Clohesyomyces aquaticus]|uniref:Putative efflux pump antibiotic resistance protein n=1 Tax=Clohesyomyces aquaticus TaxID=1231657 RepID=A0A1Y1ZUI5_9PLEO|nr:putative efflux pump antibiotic resistance protein [Clohesyomyces aquaticus]
MESKNEVESSVVDDARDRAGKEVEQVIEVRDEPVQDFPSPARLSLVMVIVCSASFLCGLDQTIVAVAVPKITNSFHALGDIAWWTSAYLLTSATLQITYGRLYTLFSTKNIYILSSALFSIGSLVCATAPNSTALIVGRAIAGCGAAGTMSGSVLVLAASCPLEKRPALSGLMFMALGISAVAGPFVGGALTDRATWRWCFGINLPICAVIILGTCVVIKTPLEEKYQRMSWDDKTKQFDLPGTGLLTACLVCLVLALQLGGTIYPWSNGRVIALLVAWCVLFLAFLLMQVFLPSQRSFSSTLVRNRNVSLAALYSGFISGGMFVVVTYLPLWFQVVKGASALRSGVMTAPLIVAFVVMSALSGAATQGMGYYNPAMFFGVMFAAIGSGLLGTLKPEISSSKWIGYQCLYGFGAGAGVPPPMLVIQTVLPTDDVPIGVSLVNLSQMLLSSVVVAIAQSVFVNELEKGVSAAIPGFDTRGLSKSGATELGLLYTPAEVVKVLPAYSNAIAKTFFIAAALSCGAFMAAMCVQWKSMKKKQA